MTARQNRLHIAIGVLNHLGVGWACYRIWYALRRKSGLLQWAAPAVPWSQLPAPELVLQTRALARPFPGIWGEACIDEAEAVLRGEFRLFSHDRIEAGFPPDWHRNQMAPVAWHRADDLTAESKRQRMKDLETQHWVEISDANQGDIKGVWEINRFPWAFTLARAFARTRARRYADAFWQLFADWCDRNPPNTGSNWMCGQEAAFRLMAVVFAAEIIGVPTAERERLSRFIVTTGRRIAVNLGYALSQKNNHAVSECVGLITAALLVPTHAESAGWLARGMRNLKSQLDKLVYADGSFAQHSLIYHRVLLHDVCWCRSRLVSANHIIPAWLDAAGGRALNFLMMLVNPATGQAPLYGANDGSNVLQLADANFLDLRPVVQMAAAVFHADLPLPEGPWDEAAAWLIADLSSLQRVDWAVVPAFWHARDGGCFVWSSGDTRFFFRCPTEFRHRPSQADLLHAEIEWRGQLILHDAGTYSYDVRNAFCDALKSARVHNTVTFEGHEPMVMVGRFLYLPWPNGKAKWDGEAGTFSATHGGWRSLGAEHIRIVGSPSIGVFTVEDLLSTRSPCMTRLHWLLADYSYELDIERSCLTLHTPAGALAVRWKAPKGRVTVVRADPNSARGWWAPYYWHAAPALSLAVEFLTEGKVQVVTRFEPLH